jgi:hypothetical protein
MSREQCKIIAKRLLKVFQSSTAVREKTYSPKSWPQSSFLGAPEEWEARFEYIMSVNGLERTCQIAVCAAQKLNIPFKTQRENVYDIDVKRNEQARRALVPTPRVSK